MNIVDKIKINHKAKSKQVQALKKKLRNRVPIGKIQELLAQEKNQKVNWQDYYGWGEVDDAAYGRAVARQEARVELLESLIRDFEKKQ